MFLDLYQNRQRVASYALAEFPDWDGIAEALRRWIALASRPGVVLRAGDSARIVRIDEMGG